MSIETQKPILPHCLLIVVLLAGMFGMRPMPARARGATGTVSIKVECDPNAGWMWTEGPVKSETADQVQKDLAQKGIQAEVQARGYGETNSCDTYDERGVDFTIHMADVASTKISSQAGFSNALLPILTKYGKPGLGNVKLISSDGQLIRTTFSKDPAPVPQADTAALATDPITRKVYVIVYDPLLSNGQKLSQYLGWNSHATITQQTVDFFKQASSNKMNFVIAQTTVVTSGWPQLVDGFAYTEQPYLAMLAGQQPPHEPSGVDYNKIITSPSLDVCGKLNRGEIDEVWIYNGPGFGFYESTLAGPGAYAYNSSPVPGPYNCNRLLPIMGPSPERSVNEAVHNFGHRTEATMTHVYGSWQENNTSHSWNKFALVKVQSPNYSYSGCGNTHFPPNGTADYDYTNPSTVLSNCNDFLNYPNLSNPLQVAQPVTCSTWNCQELNYYRYWFGHLPAVTGCGPDNVANDWWKYFASPAFANYASSACVANLHWISGNAGAGAVKLSYTDGTAKFVTADGSGNYSLLVSNHWTGVVTPSKLGYTFTPASRSYTDVQTDLYGQNYATQGVNAYYVNRATGSNNNACIAPAAPCRDIQEAIAKAEAGKTIYVAAGRYTFSSNPTPNVVIIDKNLTLSGGWNSGFSAQTGASVIDGANTNNGILSISGTVVVENFILENAISYNGGAIYVVNGSFTLRRSTVRNSVATSNGAGIFLDHGTLTVVNSTISGNSANGSGGGIYASLSSGTSVTLQNTTIAYNHAASGGGITRTNGSYTLNNTILANNSSSGAGPDCSGALAIANYSLIENMAGCTVSTGGHNLNTDPKIDGTLTSTMLVHMPLAGSPLIDAGRVTGCPSVDQLGTTRPQSNSCDIGSVELNGNVRVSIGGVLPNSFFVLKNQSLRLSYPGVNNGPVTITSTNGSPIVASERVSYSPDGGNTWTSYSELMGLPANQVTTSYIFPWYNDADLNTQLRFGNVGAASTTVTVTIGGVLRGSYSLAANQSTRVSFAGLNAGPVKLTSSGGVPIIASERVAYTPDNGATWTSFSELMGLPFTKLTTSYSFPWYNNADLNTQLRFGNVGNASTLVNVIIGGINRGTYPLGVNQSLRVSYPDVDAGPVQVISSGGVPIIASMRVAYFEGGKWKDFSELMGLPTASLSTSYSFPVYNNIDLNTQLRFGNLGNDNTTVTVRVGGILKGAYPLAPNASQRVSYPLNSGPVVIESSGGVPIIASERVAYFNGSAWTSFAEMMGLPKEQLATSYLFPWYNNVDLDSQLRFGIP